jgi:hypothetical protein
MLDLDDVRWELGRFGKLNVRHGKGSRRFAAQGPQAVELIGRPLLNKDSAYTDAERDALGLRGFLDGVRPGRYRVLESRRFRTAPRPEAARRPSR